MAGSEVKEISKKFWVGVQEWEWSTHRLLPLSKATPPVNYKAVGAGCTDLVSQELRWMQPEMEDFPRASPGVALRLEVARCNMRAGDFGCSGRPPHAKSVRRPCDPS